MGRKVPSVSHQKASEQLQKGLWKLGRSFWWEAVTWQQKTTSLKWPKPMEEKKNLFSLSALLSSFKNSINLGLSDFSIYFSYFQKRYYSLTYMLQKMHLDNLFPILFLFQKYTWKEVQLHSASTAHLRICTAAWVLTWQGCALREGRVCLWCCSHRLARHALPGGKHDHTSASLPPFGTKYDGESQSQNTGSIRHSERKWVLSFELSLKPRHLSWKSVLPRDDAVVKSMKGYS